MTSTTILYWDPLSLPCRAVKTLIDMAKIPCEYVHVDLYRGETKKSSYLKRNPLGKIPFFIDGNLKLSEADAIMIYICERQERIPNSLYGKTEKERANVHQYLSWYQGYFRPKLYKIVRLILGFFQTRKPVYQNQLDDFQAGLNQAMNNLQQVLKGKNYIANETFTIADLLFFFQIASFPFLGKDLAAYKEVYKWFKTISRIPEVKTSIDEWVPMGEQIREVYKEMKVIKSKL